MQELHFASYLAHVNWSFLHFGYAAPPPFTGSHKLRLSLLARNLFFPVSRRRLARSKDPPLSCWDFVILHVVQAQGTVEAARRQKSAIGADRQRRNPFRLVIDHPYRVECRCVAKSYGAIGGCRDDGLAVGRPD